MSKAVLVLDEMPTSCDLCTFCEIYETPSGVMTCNNPLSEEYGCCVSDYVGARPEGCPLRKLPKKRQERDAREYQFGMLGKGFEQGWNACIDEITGKMEE